MQSGRPADALALYEQAYALEPDPALLYNLGRAHQALTNYPAALTFLEKFDQESDPDLKRRVSGLDKLLAEVRAHVATVLVQVNVDGAIVRLNDKVLARTPMQGPIRVNAGGSKLEVTADGYLPHKRDVALEGGQSVALQVRLTLSETRGVLQIRSPQSGISALVNGRLSGAVPVELRLPAGQYQVELRKGGYKSLSTSVVLEPGKYSTLSVDLEEEPKFFQRWWFWSAVGVLAAGTVTAIIVYNKEKQPDVGTIPPGQISSGLSF